MIDQARYRARSLLYIRTLLSLPARYATADQARAAHHALWDGPPEVGDVAWYETATYGNVALGIGNNDVLALNHQGRPVIVTFDDDAIGVYLGRTKTLYPVTS